MEDYKIKWEILDMFSRNGQKRVIDLNDFKQAHPLPHSHCSSALSTRFRRARRSQPQPSGHQHQCHPCQQPLQLHWVDTYSTLQEATIHHWPQEKEAGWRRPPAGSGGQWRKKWKRQRGREGEWTRGPIWQSPHPSFLPKAATFQNKVPHEDFIGKIAADYASSEDAEESPNPSPTKKPNSNVFETQLTTFPYLIWCYRD